MASSRSAALMRGERRFHFPSVLPDEKNPTLRDNVLRKRTLEIPEVPVLGEQRGGFIAKRKIKLLGTVLDSGRPKPLKRKILLEIISHSSPLGGNGTVNLGLQHRMKRWVDHNLFTRRSWASFPRARRASIHSSRRSPQNGVRTRGSLWRGTTHCTSMGG